MQSALEQLYHLADEHQRAGRLNDAERTLRQIIAVQPNDSRALHNLGLIVFQQGKLTLGLELVCRSADLAPTTGLYQATLCELFRLIGRLDLAVLRGQRAITLLPTNPDAFNYLGLTFYAREEYHRATSCFERAIALNPADNKALNNMGNALKCLGRIDEAAEAFARSLTLDPTVAEVYYSYADTVTFEASNPHLQSMREQRLDDNGLDVSQRVHLDFALAKAYSDLKDHRRGFEHLLSGNALKRAQIHNDEEADASIVQRIETTFTADLLREKRALGTVSSSRAPVFIIGMPRSGTTLIEQIIASHPKVHGGGELSFLSEVVEKHSGVNNSCQYPDFATKLDKEGIAEIGAGYLQKLCSLSSTAARVTDKRPNNYYLVGLIHLAMPNATIIHCIRDPLDTCMSCFSKLFAQGQNHYTYELGELGRHYRRYHKLMRHWLGVLPPGRILEVRYEDVVMDLETQSRRLIAHCELDWDERCLSFYSTERPVKTASAAQVRRPIYQDGVGRGRLYGEFVGPLASALGDCLTS